MLLCLNTLAVSSFSAVPHIKTSDLPNLRYLSHNLFILTIVIKLNFFDFSRQIKFNSGELWETKCPEACIVHKNIDNY
ncbi:MAG: hypothetical protein DRR19_06690 [Candidatus Parabeggiatoa sp. nov. 1]|nr:MAG: hypothetical protein DRR19_06690 [Gammaproteobacteria bacterium]